MPAQRLFPATLSFAGGLPYSAAFDDVYHSAFGAEAQARHVFLAGNGLPQRWSGLERFVILETGFGLGANFLATWQAWREDADRPQRLHYVAIEKHPFAKPDLAQVHSAWPGLASLSEALRDAWPPLVPGFHRLLLDEGRVVLTLVFGDIVDCLPQVSAVVDAFYLDGFSPDRNPEMWDPALLSRLHRLAAPDATAATYTVAASVRRALEQAGFVCEKRPGFGGKRDMLAARYAPRRPHPPRPPAPRRQAIVIGAGVAGCAACERLAARGWQLTLIERHPRPAQEASGNLAGIVMPLLSRDDNLVSRLARAAYLSALRTWDRMGKDVAGERCGVLQLARDPGHARQQRETLDAFAYPADYVRWLDAAAVEQLGGNAASDGGWLFPGGGWMTPSTLCEALLAACGDRLERRFAREAISLRHDGDGWQVLDEDGRLLAQAPVLILANGTNAISFPQTQELPLTAIRGQVSHVPAESLPTLPVVLCGDGYVTRPANGVCCVGASYDFDGDPQLRQASHDENLSRLAQVLPQAAAMTPPVPMAGKVGFRAVTPDRLPLVGALPDPGARIGGSRLRDVPRLPGMHGLLGYGSRGLIWAPFAAELLAAMLEGEPLPIEQELASALDPARFALKAWRRA